MATYVETLNDIDCSEIRKLAKGFLGGDLRPIEAAVALNAYGPEDSADPAYAAFLTMNVISSETDAIPLSERRELWHPDVRAAEDAKHDRAQAWAHPMVTEACLQILALLPDD